MTPIQVATVLQNPNLLADLRFPDHKEAAKWATEFLFDLHDFEIVSELVLERPDDEGRRQLLRDCLERYKARAAA